MYNDNSMIMDEATLNKYLRELKFIVLADASTRKPFDIFFDFHCPSIHEEIFKVATKHYEETGKSVCVQGGGRITQKDNFIIFHGYSQKYGRFEDDVVLDLAPNHLFFKDKNYILLSKSGVDSPDAIIQISKFSKT